MTWSQPLSRARRGLLVVAHGADHGGAQLLGPLAGDEAHPAGGGVEQDGVAGLHLDGLAQQVLGGHPLEHHGRGRAIVDLGGQRHQPVGRQHPLLAVGARSPAGVGHPVAHPQAADPRAHLAHHARGLHAPA